MKVLVAHNWYPHRGGEETVFEAEVAMLKRHGVDVATLVVANLPFMGGPSRISNALRAVYNPASAKLMKEEIAKYRPDIVHVHNIYPRLSPSIFGACRDMGVPAVWTLHNFRIACANALLLRDGAPCEACVGTLPWPAIVHRCGGPSLPQSLSKAAMIGYHELAGTWRNAVDRFIALTPFGKSRFVAAGVPERKIAIKPNFMADPGYAEDCATRRAGVLFVGRLSAEKGIRTLIDAWDGMEIPLTIIGDGPERENIQGGAWIRAVGKQGHDAVLDHMRQAAALVIPSLCYENFPMTFVEAMATGTPVIASRIGSLVSLVEDGMNGRHFEAGNAADLRAVVRSTLADPAACATLGVGARSTYERDLTEDRNFAQLMDIYESTRAQHSARCRTRVRGDAA